MKKVVMDALTGMMIVVVSGVTMITLMALVARVF
jgi:hypothetical protein